MNLLLFLLILIGIYITMYLYDRYYNYSIQNITNYEINNQTMEMAEMAEMTTNVEDVGIPEITNTEKTNILVKKYIDLHEKNNIETNNDYSIILPESHISKSNSLINSNNSDNSDNSDNSVCKNRNLINWYLIANLENNNTDNFDLTNNNLSNLKKNQLDFDNSNNLVGAITNTNIDTN
jgi:hypothetical protein